jgi:enoyl-CoA hydratase
MSDDILTKRSGPVLEVILNRPGDGNAATDAMAADLTRIIGEAAQTSHFILLRGAGTDFCVGRASMGKPPAGPQEALDRRRGYDVIFDCYDAFRRSPVPIVGVVQGRALGFGCAIAAMCDITVASEAATFQVPEMAHNILPTMVMSALIDRVPRKALTYLVYSTAAIGALRALSIGLVSEVVPAVDLEAQVQALCAALLKEPRVAVMGAKEYARSAFTMDIHGAVDFARNLHATINSSSEMRKAK